MNGSVKGTKIINKFIFLTSYIRNGVLQLTKLQKVKDALNLSAHISKAKKVIFANESIVLFVSILVDDCQCTYNECIRFIWI